MSRWWQLKYFVFSPRKLEKMPILTCAYFSIGLVQPPPRCFFWFQVATFFQNTFEKPLACFSWKIVPSKWKETKHLEIHHWYKITPIFHWTMTESCAPVAEEGLGLEAPSEKNRGKPVRSYYRRSKRRWFLPQGRMSLATWKANAGARGTEVTSVSW